MGNRIDNSTNPRFRGRRGLAATAMAVLTTTPAVASATPTQGAPAVAVYTASAVGAVVVLAVVVGLGLHVAATVGLIGRRARVVVRRRLRVVFGVTFLLAAVTPYVALNFSVGMLLSFLATAGLVVTGWVWGAARRSRIESETSTG